MTAHIICFATYRATHQLHHVVACSRQLVSNLKVPPSPAHMARARHRCAALSWLRFVAEASAYELLQYAYAVEAEPKPANPYAAHANAEHVALARLYAAEPERPYTLPRDMELVG
jgi:hypothetical protein